VQAPNKQEWDGEGSVKGEGEESVKEATEKGGVEIMTT